jgi:RHS repeat-associated core domain
MKKKIMQKRKNSLICIILITAMLAALLPKSFYRDAVSSIKNVINGYKKIERAIVNNNSELKVISEDTNKRSINTKRFKMSDGSFTAVQYADSVHYYSGGEFLDIDNSLSYHSDNDVIYYSNIANSYDVQFYIDNPDKLYSFNTNEYGISFNLLGRTNEKTEYDVINNISNDEYDDISRTSSKFIYKNIFENVDFEYILTGSALKENIILKDKTNLNSFSFGVKTKNLTLVENETGGFDAIAINDEDEDIIFSIPAPYMFDSKGAESDGVHYELENIAADTYVVSVVADENWIDSPNIVYPVTIDPIIDANTDSFIFGAGMGETRTINQNSPITAKINLPENMPSVIKSAELSLTQVAYEHESEEGGRLEIKRIEQPFFGYSSNYLFDYEIINYEAGFTYTFDITELIRSWIVPLQIFPDTATNYGFKIIMAGPGNLTFASMYNGDPNLMPKIKINYRDDIGIEDYYSYSEYNVGRAGSAYINEYSGELTYVHEDFSFENAKLPLSVSHIYNESNYDKEFNDDMLIGKGFKLNIQQKITPVALSSNAIYEYTDSDGTNHYFVEVLENDVYKYFDEDGLNLELIILQDGYKIVENNDSLSYVFNSDGWLTSVNNKNLTVQINYVDGKIVNVTDGVNNLIFDYSPENYLTSITLDDSSLAVERTLEYQYVDGYLSSINYYDTNPTSLYYNIDGLVGLVAVLNANNYGFINSGKNSSIKIAATGNVTFSSVIDLLTSESSFVDKGTVFLFNNNNTVIMNIKEFLEEINSPDIDKEDNLNNYFITRIFNNKISGLYYQFDNEGRIVDKILASRDDDGKLIITAAYYNGGGNKNKLANITKADISYNYLTDSSFENTGLDNYFVTGSATVTDTKAYHMSKSLLLYNSAEADREVILDAGTYTFSAYVSTDIITGRGAYIGIIKNSQLYTNENLKENNLIQNNGFVNTQITFTLSETTSIQLVLAADGSGNTYFDALRLEKGDVVKGNSYNLIENGSFKNETEYWTPHGSYGISSEPVGVALNGNMYSENYISQTVIPQKRANDTYILSGIKFGEVSPLKERSGLKGICQLRAILTYQKTENGEVIDFTEVYTADFAQGRTKAHGIVSFTQNPAYDLLSIEVQIAVDYSVGEAVFTDISLIAQNSLAFYYDEDGNLINVGLNTDIQEFADEYAGYTEVEESIVVDGLTHIRTYLVKKDDQGNEIENTRVFENYKINNVEGKIIYYRDSVGNVNEYAYSADSTSVYNWVVEFGYDENDNEIELSRKFIAYYVFDNNDNIIDNITSNGVRTQKVYDDNGNIASKIIKSYENFENGDLENAELTAALYEYYQYTDNGLWLQTSKDNRGYVTSYTYDNYGKTLTVTDAKGVVTYYVYDEASDLLLEVYTYVNGEKTGVSYDYDEYLRLTKITAPNGVYYEYGYDLNNRIKTVSINGNLLVTYVYHKMSGDVFLILYANGQGAAYLYDYRGNVIEISYLNYQFIDVEDFDLLEGYTADLANGIQYEIGGRYSFSYNDGGNLIRAVDYSSNLIHTYEYNDNLLLLITQYEFDYDENYAVTSREAVSYYEYLYDEYGTLINTRYHIGDEFIEYKNIDVPIGSPGEGEEQQYENRYILPSGAYFKNEYDKLNRIIGRTLYSEDGDIIWQENYEYLAGDPSKEAATTRIISKAVYNNGDYIEYCYDELGNIKVISKNGIITNEYFYDELSRLIGEDDLFQNITTAYQYDNNGNILSKTRYSYDTEDVISKDIYVYDAEISDLLIEIDYYAAIDNELVLFDSKEITYSQDILNPDSYLGWELVWNNVRQLSEMYNGDENLYFTYNEYGIRISKTYVNGDTTIITKYFLNGKDVIGENRVTLVDGVEIENISLYYIYESGEAVGFKYDGDFFYYLKNIQGDITNITDNAGNILVSYTYDAWGAILDISYDGAGENLASLNPFTYRGYYYDSETGLYYLQSRFYDPQVGRFINRDTMILSNNIMSINGFVYAYNNVVMNIDIDGRMAVLFLRMLSNIYNHNIINTEIASFTTLCSNGFGYYTAFHEIAQLNIAKELFKRGYIVTLEDSIKNVGEADITAHKIIGYTYIWEVKPIGQEKEAQEQLKKYIAAKNFKRGFSLGVLSNIAVAGKIKMKITFDNNGGAYYEFTCNGTRVTNAVLAQLLKALDYSMKAACAVAGAIIILTLVEDIATGGLGIWNDGPSLSGAAASAASILRGGLLIYGFI